MPDAVAVACPTRAASRRADVVERESGQRYRTITFAQLDADATRFARGLVEMGVTPGQRLALLVPAGIEFVTLVFALLRSGATTVLVDPGMGRRSLVSCLADAEPEGFVAVSHAHG
jgi:acyl-coenzyme A synthetase/AMP-(fatty) acid ligase